jgi:hypothetical protein
MFLCRVKRDGEKILYRATGLPLVISEAANGSARSRLMTGSAPIRNP